MAEDTVSREDAQRYISAALRQRNEHADSDLQKIVALEAAVEKANSEIASLKDCNSKNLKEANRQIEELEARIAELEKAAHPESNVVDIKQDVAA